MEITSLLIVDGPPERCNSPIEGLGAVIKNPRLTNKDIGLIKAGLRRAFSRSELRKRVLDRAVIQHTDPSRPRVTKWIRCKDCQSPTPAYLSQCDHLNPVVKVEEIGYTVDCNTLVDRLWCREEDLQFLCKVCHQRKTKAENRERRLHKKGKR